MARLISTSVLLTLIIILGITFFRVIAPFLLPLFLAGVVTLLCQPLFRYFLDRTNGRVRVSAGLTTASVVAAFLVPVVSLTLVASAQTYDFAASIAKGEAWSELVSVLGADEALESPWEAVSSFANWFLPSDRETSAETVETMARAKLRDAFNELGNRSLGIAGTTLDVLTDVIARLISIILGILIFVIAVYYFFADGTALIRASEKMIPVHVEYQRQLLNEFATVVRSVVTATFMSALAQAAATVAALWLCGFDHLMILFVLATITSLVPLAGAWLVWGPCAAILVLGDHTVSAVLLTIYGIGVVGILDNVIRAYVLNSDTKLHPLLAFISVLGGLQVLGLWGVFIGPIVASCLHALVQIFNHELVELSREQFGTGLATAGAGPDSGDAQKPAQSVERRPDVPLIASEAVGDAKEALEEDSGSGEEGVPTSGVERSEEAAGESSRRRRGRRKTRSKSKKRR